MPLAAKYSSLLFLLLLSLAIPAILVGIASLSGPRRPTTTKDLPFECGVDPVGEARKRFLFRKLGLFGFIEMAVFLLILLLGLLYVWKKGALEWE
jgi:NADH-quinone oxidoreductase subunit A